MEKTHYVLDWYANKNLAIKHCPYDQELTIGKKIVYYIDQPGGKKLSVWTYIGENYKWIEKKWYFSSFLSWEKEKNFEKSQKKAYELFPLFKKNFRRYFSTAIPVTARYHIFSKQYYFYFYSEERFQFTHFLKDFRSKIGENFFLFQVGARDMVKMSPQTDHLVWCNGKNLCCKSNRPLPSVNVEALVIQHLEWRDIERLKGRCGKLKCSLLYEVALYLDENKQYPAKGTKIKSKSCESCGVVTNYNIINRTINFKDREWAYVSISLDELKKDYEVIKKQK